jgi:hypothetical protein
MTTLPKLKSLPQLYFVNSGNSGHHRHIPSSLLCTSRPSQALTSIHGGPNLHVSGIGDTSASIHPRHVPWFGKLVKCLIPDHGFHSIDFGISSLLHDASLCPRLLCSFLDIGNLDFSIIDIGYLKHNFLDNGYNYSLGEALRRSIKNLDVIITPSSNSSSSFSHNQGGN